MTDMRILVADDHALFRDILSEYVLKAAPDSEVFLAASLTEAIDLMEEVGDDIDIIMLDIMMPGMNGLEGISLVAHKFPKTKIAIISGTIEPEAAQKAIQMGAIGYFPKTLSAASFIPALKLVLSGQQYLPTDLSSPTGIMRAYYGDKPHPTEHRPRMASYAVHDQASSWQAAPEKPRFKDNPVLKKLTKRERETLLLVSKGLTNKEIGHKLGIEEVTVKLHVRSIFKKLDVRNRTEATNLLQETA